MILALGQCALVLQLSEVDLVPFATAAEDPLLRLSLADPFLAAAEAATVSAVRASLEAAEPLRQELDEVASSLKRVPSLPVDIGGRLELHKLQAELEGYEVAEERLRQLAPRVAARIFAVDGEQAKATLRSKAKRLKEELCGQALAWLENETKSIHEAWTEALGKASAVPTSEQELISLKKYLAVVSHETAPLVSRGRTVSELLVLLEGYFAFAPSRVQKQVFELDCCPMRLKMALCETNGILDLAKERVRPHESSCASRSCGASTIYKEPSERSNPQQETRLKYTLEPPAGASVCLTAWSSCVRLYSCK